MKERPVSLNFWSPDSCGIAGNARQTERLLRRLLPSMTPGITSFKLNAHLALQENPRWNARTSDGVVLPADVWHHRCSYVGAGPAYSRAGLRDPLNLGAAPEVGIVPPVFWSPRWRRRALDVYEPRCRTVSRLASDRVFCARHTFALRLYEIGRADHA